jgi:hypothetical protein
MRSNDSAKRTSFCFVSTRETAIAGSRSCFIPAARADLADDQIVWKKERSKRAIVKRHNSVVASIEPTSAKIGETLNAVLDTKESARTQRFDICKSAKNPTAESNARC